MPPSRIPIAHHLNAVGVASVDHRAHDPGRQHFPGRNQGFDLNQLGLLLFAAPTRRGGRGNRDHEPSTPLQPHQPAQFISLGAQRAVTVLGRQRMQPTRHRLEAGLAFSADVPLLDRIERPPAQILGLLRRQVLAHPRFTQRGGKRLRRIAGEPVRLLDHPKCRTARRALGRCAARHLPRDVPPGIGFNHAATRDQLTQHCVVHPRAGEEPCPDVPALHRIRTQRPDRTCVGAPFGRLRARGLRPAGCGGPAAGVGSMRYPLRICTARP